MVKLKEGKWCKKYFSSFIHVNGGGNWASLQVSTHAAQTTMSYKLMKISHRFELDKQKTSSQQEEKLIANV